MQIKKNGHPPLHDQNVLNISSHEIFNLTAREPLLIHSKSNVFYSSATIKKNHFNNSLIHNLLNSRIKRAGDDKTLVEATVKNQYSYWLSQEDIAEIARLEYNNYHGESNAEFEILGSMSQLQITLESFQLKVKANQFTESRLTLIINLENLHWVTLAISYKNDQYVGYYTDSKNNPIPSRYFQLLFNRFLIQPLINLSPGFIQQKDNSNCGLWALENAADLNQMIDQDQSIHWIINKLKRSRSKEYFDTRREYFAEKLRADSVWRERHPLFSQDLTIKEALPTNIEPDLKRFKAFNDEKEKVTILLETFVETFMSAFVKKLGAYHLLAKGESLTEESLKTELKTGLSGALLGIGISQSLVGSIPSLVASLRMISGKFYPSKDKAQKITKIFSEIQSDYLNSILSESAVDIFQSFESQFVAVTDKAGSKVAMEKLAEDAVGRLFNAIDKYSNLDKIISKELIEKSVLQGPSEKFFDPNVKRARLRVSGYTIQDNNEKAINTANLFEKIGLVDLDKKGQSHKFYAFKPASNNAYGYRRLLDWEQEENGELKENLKNKYTENQFLQEKSIFHFISKGYRYVLHKETNPVEARRILDKIANRYPPHILNREPLSKKPIYFDLRKPVKNFSGRIQVLERLHRTLISERTTAIVPSWSMLSISPIPGVLSPPDSESSQTSGSQLSINGLGGIGKTQLALRYAELYAQNYDHNVLWINAETKENIAYSFNKLTAKLQIITKDSYNQEKMLEKIVEEVYEYFSDRKSLFIFDNVENYRAIEAYLPKSMLGNKPSLLITSRYSNWSNIATIMTLNVFSELETKELIKKSLDLGDNIPYERIKELHQLLQGLPLALQQALAYIKLRRNTDTSFSLSHYIELYKEKTKELLNFDFSHYSNDPYLETVFTTWLITLDKIKADPLGNHAIEILNIMGYLYPDIITSKKFYYFNHINRELTIDDLDTIMHLLSSYSMINLENEGKYTIHRLVQQIIRIDLEQNQPKFKEIVEKTQHLLWLWHFTFKKDEESVFHYLHFLLYMSEHTELISKVMYSHPEKTFFDNLLLQNVKYCHYFIDLAYLKYPKEKFLRFLGDAVAYYIKLGSFFNLSEIFNYIEKKWQIEILSKENIKYILDHFYNMKNPLLKMKRYSTIPSKKANQKQAIKLLYELKMKIFGNQLSNYDSCPSHSLKRSVCALSEPDQDRIKEISNSRIKAHFKKIEQVSRYISSALMTKDTLSALLQGHFDEVAINFGLMTSSLFFGSLSNSLFAQGKNLASDASLLEKNLGLENKKVLTILFNEDVLSMGKRKLLGKAMQVASPFVSKATSIFFAYNLKNEIQLYRMGDETVLPSLTSNSLIVAVDGIEATIEGAEFLGFITGLSAFTGPLGEGIALLVWLGAEGYAAKQQVEAIEKYVHLSRGEKSFEFLLATLHQAPLEYLQLKANNGQLVENAINLLKNNTDIQWSIFPSFHFEADLCKIRKVFLNEKINFTPDDNNPDEPAEGNLVCLSASPPPYEALNEAIKMKYYLCHKALGVSYTLNRTGNGTLVDLGEGEDEVIAFSHSPTLFIVQNGKKWYVGGDNGNVFNLQGNSITGQLQGGKGSDILVLDNFYPENSDYLLLDTDGFLCGKNKSLLQQIPPFCSSDEIRVQIDQIDQIYGRKNESDIFYLDQSVCFIDGYGGKNQTHPDNFFITNHSYKNLKFVLRNNTLITFLSDATTDSIEYRIPSDEVGESWIYYFKETLQHQFFFEYPLENLEAMTVKNNTLHISVLTSENTDRKLFAITISNRITSSSNQTKNTANLSNNIAYFFQDIEIKLIHNEHLYGQEITSNNKTMDEKISLFSEIANRLEKTISIQLVNNLTLSIGRQKKHELFYINGLHESHLVGNGGENVYIILPGKNTKFPLPKVILYDTSERDSNDLIELIDTLDLREIIKEYKQIYPKAVISSHVFPSANDLILTLSNSVYSPIYPYFYDSTCFWPWVTIQLKNALLDNSNWYQKLDIVLDSVSRNIVALEDDVWTLTAAPLMFTDDKKIILLTHQDLEEKSEILILKNIGNFAFFRDEMNLILTNAFPSSMDYCTIICCQFYQMPEMKKKILSATFKFFDYEIHPQDYQKEIKHATHFSYLSQLFSSNSPNVSDIIAHAFLNTVGMQNQKKLPPQILRRKRQAHREEKRTINTLQKSTLSKEVSQHTDQTFFPQMTHYPQSRTVDEKKRILAMADEYLKKYDDSEMKAYRGKKNINQTKNKKKKTNPLLSVQKEKAKSFIEKNDSVQHKNEGNFYRRTMPNYSAQNNSKTLAKSPTKNQFRTPAFSKPETTKLKKTFFNDLNSDKKRNFLVTPKFLPHQESFKSTTKALSLSPKLTYQPNESRPKKSNQHTVPSSIAPPNLHSTLMLFDLIARKSLKNPVVPSSYNKKLNKTIRKVEKQKENIKSKTFGFQKL